MTFLGIDLHSNCFSCCFIYENGSKEKKYFNLEQTDLERFYLMLTLDTYVLIESSTNTFKFVEMIKEKVKQVYVANTHKLKLISLVKKKTDKIDAEKLAIYIKMQILSNEELIKPVYIPEQTIQDLRSLFTTYRLLRRHIGAIKNRIHALLKQNMHAYTKEYIFGKLTRKQIKELYLPENQKVHLYFLFDDLENKEDNIEIIANMIKRLGSKYYKEIELLTSMKGISIITAIALIADIADIKRFPNSKHLTSYLRSAPGIDSSNEEKKVLSTNKLGRKLSVSLLSQSLNHFRDSNVKLNRWYNKKIEIEKQKKGKIRMGLTRKVFSEIYQMLKKGEYHYYRNEINHNNKMKQYDKFLESYNINKNIA